MGRPSELVEPITSGLLEVGYVRLYHEVRGSGPALLFISGGSGDAGGWAQVASALAEEFTVVTYDRRGCSRSPRPDGWTSTSLAEQADDAAGLLRALDLAPAGVVGHSGGASIACDLVARHTGVVRRAMLYEPPLFAVVPGGPELAAGMRAAADQAMAQGGPRQAMEACMRASGVPLTVIVGADNRDTWFDAAAAWLAEGTGADRVELPRGHVGFYSHPDAFLDLLRRTVR